MAKTIVLATLAALVIGGAAAALVFRPCQGGCEQPALTAGAPKGDYDGAMVGCRFSCASKDAPKDSVLASQPNAPSGSFTRCPVSGVVIEATADRPHVQLEGRDYVTCCDTCAQKLRAEPSRFLAF